MKARYTFVLFCFIFQLNFAQVGIGTTSPSASLDIQSSNQSTPANTDGLLIPKIDEYPASNPGANQDGMLVYATGNGAPSKGFYYWDNATTFWVNVKGLTQEIDPQVGNLTSGLVPRWNGTTLEDGTIFNSATNVGIGTINPQRLFDVRSGTGTATADWISGAFGPANVGNRVVVGNLNGNATIGSHNSALNAWSDLYLNSGGRVEIPHIVDASHLSGSGSLEIGNRLRIDDNEIITNSNAVLYLNNNNNGDVIIDNNTLRVDASTNKVGIGTGTPGAIITNSKLDVIGGHVAVSNDYGFLSFNSANNGIGAGFDTSPTDDLYLFAGGSNRLTVTNSGNVSAPSFTIAGINATGNRALITKEYADANYDFSGDYNDLINLPTLFNGDYNSLTSLPTLFDGDYTSLTNLPTLFDGDYNSLTSLPVLFSEDYNDLTNLPTLFSGDYNDLTNQPTITSPTGLEALNEGNGLGWRLIGRNPANYGNIGSYAVDLSIHENSGTTNGATGNTSFATGLLTTASGNYSSAMGQLTVASGWASFASGQGNNATGWYSTALGNFTLASGNRSFSVGHNTIASGESSFSAGSDTEALSDFSTALGNGTRASSIYGTSIGRFNIGGGNPTWDPSDPLFEIGNGTSNAARSNALTILKNGTITAPSFDISEITDNKALITKEYADTNYFGTNPTGLEALDEGNGIGWRLIGSNPANHGNIGLNAVDLSINPSASTTRGATGESSFAIGESATAQGRYSMAIGAVTSSLGDNSVALGHNAGSVGHYSTSIGRASISRGNNSSAIGNYNDTWGEYSSALGSFLWTYSFANVSVGRYNITGSGVYDSSNWVLNEPIFEVGNGTSNAARSNALTVLKNGNVGIGTHTPGSIITNSKLDVIGGHVAVSNNYGVLSFNSTNTGFGAGFDTTGSDGLDLYAGGVNRVNVLANGDFQVDNTTLVVDASTNNVGIGTSTPSTKLQIIGGGDASLANGAGFMTIGDESGLNINIDNNEIMARNNGAASPLYLQQNGGAVHVNGAVVHASDRRLKTNIEDLNYGLAEILKLQPKAYHWKNRPQNKKSLGLIAQDVQLVINEIVTEQDSESQTLAVNYTELIPVLINATQEQQKLIEQQQQEIEDLKKELNKLESLDKRMVELEALLDSANN